MRRILWVNGWPGVGGAERAQFALFERLVNDFDTHLVFPEEAAPALADEARKLAIPYTRAPLTQLRQTLDPRMLARHGYRLMKTTWILTKLIRRHSIDLIHTAYLYDIPFCAPAAKLTRTPMLWLIDVPHPVLWTQVNATPPGVARAPRGPRSACDTRASRAARSCCTAPRTRSLRRVPP